MHENVLVIEDNALDRKIICSILEKNHLVPIESEDAFEALEKIDEQEIHLILLDVKLPKCSGFDLLKRLGNYTQKNNVPIIMMSANRLDKSGVLQSFKYGASDFIVKPIRNNILIEKIEKLRKSSKLGEKIAVEIPGDRACTLSSNYQIARLESSGIVIEGPHPMSVGQILRFNSKFFEGYGIGDIDLTVQIVDRIGDSYQHYLNFSNAGKDKVQKIKTIYKSLADEMTLKKQSNFRGEA